MIQRDLVHFESENKPRFITELNDNLNRTLILSCIGFSNKAIANLFDLSEKAVELRFSQLFDYLNVDTKNQAEFNPRVSLFISAYCRENIKRNQIQRLYKESTMDRLEKIFDDPSSFISNLQEEYRFIG